jgi:alanine-alpha-ketoisovalerate/valine-pyruvate aminotransferase
MAELLARQKLGTAMTAPSTAADAQDDAELLQRVEQALNERLEWDGGQSDVSLQFGDASRLFALASLSPVTSPDTILVEALRELLSAHDNLYVAHWGPNSDPTIDIAAKPARQALASTANPIAE